MNDLVQTRLEDGVFEIRMNRPEKKNALTYDMYQAMFEALVDARDNKDAKVVLFRGSDDCFTAGNDLMDFMQRPPLGDDAPVALFMRELFAFEKPVVAAVVGAAVGIGTTMLLHCDLAYAGASAKFKMPFVDLGLVPEFGSSAIVPEMIGHRKAAEFIMLADSFDAETAADLGFVNAHGSDEEVHEMAWDAARRLAKKAPQALRMTKKLMKATRDRDAAKMQEESACFGERLGSPELQEAGKAFFEKRAPDFSQFG